MAGKIRELANITPLLDNIENTRCLGPSDMHRKISRAFYRDTCANPKRILIDRQQIAFDRRLAWASLSDSSNCKKPNLHDWHTFFANLTNFAAPQLANLPKTTSCHALQPMIPKTGRRSEKMREERPPRQISRVGREPVSFPRAPRCSYYPNETLPSRW